MKLHALALHPPTSLGSLGVERVVDLQAGLTLPPTPGVILELADGQRACIRPSGTEPKLKFYLDARVAFDAAESSASARARVNERLDEMEQAVASLF